MGAKMKETNLLDLYYGKVKDYPYNIYVLKAYDVVVYVGRSIDIHARWFGGLGRLHKTAKWFRGEGALERMISDNPSWDWKIQLWTIKEAGRFCRLDAPISLNRVEGAMISKLRPVMNGNMNDGPTVIPDFIKA